MAGRIVVIGASPGGVDTLVKLVGQLPAKFPAPILVTQHALTGLLPQILTRAGKLKAMHPRSPQALEAGVIYVAPPESHMLVSKGYVRLSHGLLEDPLTGPSIDPLFRSAALAYGSAVIGVIITGPLEDGTAGLLAVKDHGGVTIVEQPVDGAARAMPPVTLDRRGTPDEIARLLLDLASS
jgi:two-component system chemotaxis response regulator CheB